MVNKKERDRLRKAADRKRLRDALLANLSVPSTSRASQSTKSNNQLLRRKRETEEQKKKRFNEKEIARKTKESRESMEQKVIRRNELAEAKRILRNQEEVEERSNRQSRQVARQKRQRDAETQERRTVRLDQMVSLQNERIEHEEPDQTAIRLNKQATRQQELRNQETGEEYVARLDQMLVAQQERISTETPIQRSARIDQLVVARQIRQSDESEEQRVERLRLRSIFDENLRQRNLSIIQQRRRAHRGARTYLQACDVNTIILKNNLGIMNVLCNHCQALLFKSEIAQCCKKGKIQLPSYCAPTSSIQSLFDGSHSYSQSFLKNIRHYNTALSFASLSGEQVQFSGPGPYTFQMHGSVYHRASAVLSSERPAFAQLYIVDPDAALQERMRDRDMCNTQVMKDLSCELSLVSPLVHAYKQMFEIVKEEEERAVESGRPALEPVHMWMVQSERNDPRRYNAPTTNQIAIVIDTPDGEIDRARGVSVFSRFEAGSHFIPTTSPLLDALLYPIFFPHGDYGWTFGIPYQGSGGKNISMREYYAYRLQVRKESVNILHNGRSLLQQFLVDVYTRIEGSRTSFLRLNQGSLRIEQYQGLLDYIANQDPIDGPPGRAVILPSSFTGGPRYLQQQYQDAIAMVIKKGRPDLFITFTTNPKWPEIINSLLPGQDASCRPDIVTRVFSLKVKALLNDIVKKQIFGNVAAYSYSIEFQKRGLPHMHLLVILEGADKIVGDPEIVDTIIQAEIPDPESDSILHSMVRQHMMHGPCGIDYEQSPCMKISHNDKLQCQKYFPKKWQETTELAQGSYPVYKRRDNGVTIEKRGVRLDSRYVVPYNRYLLLKYEAHINVEICSSISCIKYLYKYFYKGHDRASMEISTTFAEDDVEMPRPYVHDEIRQFIDARYIAAPEAAWRLFKYDMCKKSHSVLLLAVHLQHQQQVTFEAGQEIAAAGRAGETTLTAWFKLNQKIPAARVIHYTDIPEHYVFEARTKEWQPRRRKLTTVMGRMPLINPNQGEKFYLRLLLLHVTGSKSFEELRTVEGELKPTFRAAALALGLLETDNEWLSAMKEAETFQMPRQLRTLFATILAFCAPLDPQGLWNSFADSMSQHLQPPERAKDIALAIIGRKLEKLGHSLREYGFDESIMDSQNGDDPAEVVNTSTIPPPELNPEQKQIVDAILRSTESGEGGCFFVDGPGGTGKTFLYNTLINILSERDIGVKAVASTGIAATLLRGGQTAHSAFKLPVPTVNTTTSSMTRFSPAGQNCIGSKVIIWDEAPMQHRYVFEAVDRLFKDLMRNNRPFGGKTVLLGGDFRQILPVIRGGSREACIGALITRSTLWQHFTVYRLTLNMRLDDGEAEFASLLLRIGSGEANVPGSSDLLLPGNSICPSNKNFVNEVFQECVNTNADLSSVAILCPHNEQSLLLNEEVLSMLPGESKQYLSTDTLESDEDRVNQMIPVEYLYELTPGGLPPHTLNLKIGAIIMLMRNMNVAGGMCNGTRLQVENMLPHLIVAKLLTGPFAGEHVFLPRISLQPSDSELQIKFTRRQFPVRLSFAMTINKAQGQTFKKLGLCLKAKVFSHGQLYVALSRCTRLSSIHIQVPFGEHYTRNIVFPEALL